jgi:hypothetical protein
MAVINLRTGKVVRKTGTGLSSSEKKGKSSGNSSSRSRSLRNYDLQVGVKRISDGKVLQKAGKTSKGSSRSSRNVISDFKTNNLINTVPLLNTKSKLAIKNETNKIKKSLDKQRKNLFPNIFKFRNSNTYSGSFKLDGRKREKSYFSPNFGTSGSFSNFSNFSDSSNSSFKKEQTPFLKNTNFSTPWYKSFDEKKDSIKIKNPWDAFQRTSLGLGAFVGGTGSAVKDAVVGFYDTITNPKQSAKGLKDFATNPETRKKVHQSIVDVAQKAQQGSGSSLGYSFGTIYSPKTPSVLNKVASSTYKNANFIKKTQDKATNYLDKNNLKGTDNFPSVKSTKELNKFLKNSNNKVVTSSNAKLKGGVVGDSRKSALNLEDPGIYVSPKGKGNKYFLRQATGDNSKYTFNPKTLWQSIKQDYSIPSVTEFKTKGSVVPPKKALNSKGFQGVSKWQQNKLSNTGKISVTKRGLLGRGEIKRKSKRDKGTSEIEFVIPKGSNFKVKPTNKYILVDGKKVLIRKGTLDTSRKYIPSKLSDSKLNTFISKSKLNKSSSSYNPNIKYKSPYKYGLYSPRYSPSKPYSPSNSYFKGKGNSYFPTPSKFKGKSPFSGGSTGKGSSGGFSGVGSSSGKGSSFGSSSSGYSSSSYSALTGSKGRRLPKLKNSKVIVPKKGFNLYIKKRGVLTQLNAKPLSYSRASSMIKQKVDNSLLRSGFVVGKNMPSKSKSKKFNVITKGKSRSFIEKKPYLFDSKLEKTQGKRLKRFKK